MKRKTSELKGIWWNVWHDSRDTPEGAQRIAQRVRELIHEYDPDWICLQEAYRYKDRDVVGLVQQTSGWDHIFSIGNEYHYSNGTFKKGNNYSEGVVTFSKWPIIAHESVTLGPSIWGDQKGLGGERTLLEVELKTPAGKVIVGNAHWTRIRYNYRAHRKGEMKVFRERMESLPKDRPYVVGGDFNTLPSHPIIRKLRKTLDLRSGGIKNTTWIHKAKKGRVIRCNLDYAGTFHEGPLAITDFRMLEREPSDHTPLLVKFSYNKNTKEK